MILKTYVWKKNIFCSDAGYLWWSHAGALWDLQDLSKIKIPLQSRSSRTGSQIAAHLVQQVKHCVPLCLRWIKTPCVLQSKKKKIPTIPLTMIFDWWPLVFSAVLLSRSIVINFAWKLPPGSPITEFSLNQRNMLIYVHMSENIYIYA